MLDLQPSPRRVIEERMMHVTLVRDTQMHR
jgi:hypothetical protein